MKYILIFILLFGLAYAQVTIYTETDLNPSGTMEAKNSMSGTFGYGYLGEDVDYGDVLYLNSDGKWYTYLDTVETVLVMSSGYGKIGKLHKFLTVGYATKYDWSWTVGTKMYPHATVAGTMQQTNPTGNKIILGVATQTDEIYFDSDAFQADDASGIYLALSGDNMEGSIGIDITIADGEYASNEVYLGTAGETFAFGDVIYIASDGECYICNADSTTFFPAIGIAVSAGTDGNTFNYINSGRICESDWSFSDADKIYVKATAVTTDCLTATAPSTTNQIIQRIGIQVDTDIIEVKLTYPYYQVP